MRRGVGAGVGAGTQQQDRSRTAAGVQRTRAQQHILRLQVAVEDALLVAAPHRVQQLPKHAARHRLLQRQQQQRYVQ